MKKIFSKTLIGFLLLSIFLAPVGVGINTTQENKLVLNVEVNEARAEGWWFQWTNLLNIGIEKNYATEDACKIDEAIFDSDITTVISIHCNNGPIPTLESAVSTITNHSSTSYLVCWEGMDEGINVKGCIASFFYAFWEVSAWFARGAGHFLDFFIDYSVQSGSYKNDFIEKGWGAIRDVANIFFIVALLYVGLKTILGMNVSNNKRLVGTIILIALVINFSLFTTKVVIDASNVLAKIFYNNISPVDENGVPIPPNSAKNKSITVGMVGKFNPQAVITEEVYIESPGKFIFVTIIALLITLYMAYIFISVALLFLARVVTLWISMIFSPIAFASLTIEADMGGLGFKKWWGGLLKTAFMAPLFIFFLYIIVLFLDVLGAGTINFTSDNSTIQNLMKVVIPFAILGVLLMKAKKLAVEYSGEMGEMITKAGTAIGGLAIGAATGGAAMLGSGTIGKYASKVANNDELKAKAAAGDKGAQRRLAFANSVASKSFDFRQTGAGKMLQSKTGLNLSQGTGAIGLGEDKFKGGNTARDERILEKKEKKLKTYQLSKAGAEKQNEKAKDEKEPQNIRAAEYEKDKEAAKKIAENKSSPEKEKWEEEFQKAYQEEYKGRIKTKENEKGFKEEYEKKTPPPIIVSSFDEKKFKEDYIKGGNLKEKYELDKTVEGGSVKKVLNAADTNEERRKAYANSLDNEVKEGDSKNTKVRKAMSRFSDNFREGFGQTLSTPKGLATTAVVGAMTGGIGLALAPVMGGFLKAFREQFKEGNRSTNAELVAGIRKGMDKKEKALKDIAAAFGGDLNLVANATKVAAKTTPVVHIQTPESAPVTEHKIEGDGHTK